MGKVKNDKVTTAAAATGTEDKKDKVKVKKIAYPGLKHGADGNPTVKLKEWPADFDRKLHEPLQRTDFENEAPWLLDRAERLEKMAANCRKNAELALKFGNKKERQAAKKISQFTDKIAELAVDLLMQDVSPEVLKGMGISDEMIVEFKKQAAELKAAGKTA